MQLQLLPVMHIMMALYRQPRGMARFQAYLKALQGNTRGNLALPIGSFNPMAKKHALHKLEHLETLGIEAIIADALAQLAKAPALQKAAGIPMRVAFNLADDVAGGWTDRYATDYDSCFRIGALVKRGFITPLFWTSEEITEALVRVRTAAACFRTAYWLQHGIPQTLGEHLAQEAFAAAGCNADRPSTEAAGFTEEQASRTEPSFIFNALYGDRASEGLGYQTHGFAAAALDS